MTSYCIEVMRVRRDVIKVWVAAPEGLVHIARKRADVTAADIPDSIEWKPMSRPEYIAMNAK